MFFTFDIEASGLLDETTVDYTCSPFKLKPSFCLHCIVLENQNTGEIIAFHDGEKYELDGREYVEEVEGVTYTLKDYQPLEYTHRPLNDFRSFVKKNITAVVGHNIINYDLMVLKAKWNMDFSVEPDSWDGKQDCSIIDTLVLSKTLNPDRYDGHSLESWGKRVGVNKVDFRPHLSQEQKFKHFAADMLYYCIFDVKVNTKTYQHLVVEMKADNWNWTDAISLEKSVAEIVTRGTHRGFWFDKQLAKQNVEELDVFMEERRARIEPILPPKQATKKLLDEYTPPAKQIKMNLDPTSYMIKWVEKMEGEFLSGGRVRLLGKEYDMPIPNEPILKTAPATVVDTTHIKEWLVSLGWSPSEYKERDLTVDAKKNKLTEEKFEKVVDKYVEQTLNSSFCSDRCDSIGVAPEYLKRHLLSKGVSKRLKVPTNPSFTKGQEKEVCPNLLLLSDQFPFAKDIVEYLTYRHRRNSILGGGMDWDEEEEMEKGFIASVREDGRIPTPADTCGAATSRFKHRVVANVPRCTSLYGENMRAMFGVEDDYFQVGYDFDSLEARIEAHYCYKFDDEDKSYSKSLIAKKPNDIHSNMARAISQVLGKEFKRDPAKNVKYGATYGAQPPKMAKMLGCDLATAESVFKTFWQKARPLKMFISALENFWEKNGKKYIQGIDGRKVPTRAKHALANSAFQSAGVICAKRAMVIHDRMLKEQGYAVDFWTQDWKNMQYFQQIIAYHDEAQSEVTKGLVKFKSFNTEDEAKEFKKTRKDISDVGHGKDGKYYVALCQPGYLATEAVRLAGEYYKLNVALSSGYMVHKNWAGTH